MSLRRVLASVRRLSARVYALLVVVLLGVVYVAVLPWFAIVWRLRGRPRGGWSLRDDRSLASVERLRSPF